MKTAGDSFDGALKYAFLLLRYRDRSEKEIVRRLSRKGFAEETGRKVRDYLKEKGFVDDARFAETLKRTAVEQKHLGKRGIVQYLLTKGIPVEIAEGISGDDDDYIETARNFAGRKMRQLTGLETNTAKRRLWAALARKGYSQDIIGRVMKNCFDDDEVKNDGI